MPGLIVSTFSAENNQNGLQALYRTSRYSFRTIFNQKSVFIGAHLHDLYPFNDKIENDLYFVLEGQVYNFSFDDIKKSILSKIRTNDHSGIATFVRELDGEFVILVFDKTHSKIFIINDAFGRLPLYYKKEKSGIIITREIQFILKTTEFNEMNKLSIAHQLLFGYTLGEHTIWEDIKRVQPHSIIQIDLSNNRVEYNTYFNISPPRRENYTISDLSAAFCAAIDNRMNFFPNSVLSLSGGLDSRLIAAACSQMQIDIQCATYSFEGTTNSSDVNIAREISSRLNFSNHFVLETAAKEESTETLLNCKAGLNYLAMDFIVPYHEWHARKDFTSITGDGGDKFFVDIKPLVNLHSAKHFLKYLLHNNGIAELKTVSEITGLSIREIEESIISHVAGFDVTDWNERYARFMIRERGINWLFEGEDRCRYFTWITSPYYAPNVINISLQFSDDDKKHGKLFAKLLQIYPGKLDQLMNPNWMCAPSDLKKVKHLFNKQKLKFYIPFLKKNKAFNLSDFRYENELRALLSSSKNYCTEVINNKPVTEELLWNLYTILRVESMQDISENTTQNMIS